MPTEKDLFSAVDALLEQVPSDDLPPPAERRRLREAAGLSQTQIATALGTRREAVGSWEAGQREPRPPQRAAYARLLEGLAQRFPAAPADVPPASEARPLSTRPAAAMANHENPKPATPPAAAAPAAPSRPASAARSTSTPRRPAARKATATKAPAMPAPAPAAVGPRFAHGPLGVLDGNGSLYCAGGLVLECQASSVPDLVAWTLAEAQLGHGSCSCGHGLSWSVCRRWWQVCARA
jgi:DNA-binding transcriptional regulator YiaG